MNLRFLPLAVAISALLTIIPACSAIEPGVGFHVVRYDLDLNPNLQSKSLSGAEVIKFRSLTDGLRTMAFSGNSLTIDSVTMNGRPVHVSIAQHTISLELPEALKQGRSATLRIAYHGSPKRGVVFAQTSVYTSYSACDWMVCSEDAPGDKAAFALDLHVPAGMTSLAVA
jgi:aminopeptidase N